MSNTATRPEEERVTPERTSVMPLLKHCGTVVRIAFVLTTLDVMTALFIMQFFDPCQVNDQHWLDHAMLCIAVLAGFMVHCCRFVSWGITRWLEWLYFADYLEGCHFANYCLEWTLVSMYRLDSFLFSLYGFGQQQTTTMTNLCICAVPFVIAALLDILIGYFWGETPTKTAVVAEEAVDDVSGANEWSI